METVIIISGKDLIGRFFKRYTREYQILSFDKSGKKFICQYKTGGKFSTTTFPVIKVQKFFEKKRK